MRESSFSSVLSVAKINSSFKQRALYTETAVSHDEKVVIPLRFASFWDVNKTETIDKNH